MSERLRNARRSASQHDVVFAQLYDDHYRTIHDYCRRRVANDEVDDAVAETFLVAWRRLDEVPMGDAARLWLYRVAYRVIGHQWRSISRRQRLERRLSGAVARKVASVDDSIVDDDDCRRVLAAATTLNDTDAEVLRLVAWEQLSICDVADVLGITPNAVKQRLHRARRNLARVYRRLESPQSIPDAPRGGVL
jgi:RNA polymerase sigma-70 factor, ECF subfamily